MLLCCARPPSPPLPSQWGSFHWCTYCKVFPLPPSLTTSTWPITDDSLYTHKQNKAQTVITELLHTFTHAAQQCLSATSVSLFVSPPSLFLSLYFSPSVSLFTVNTVARMDAHRVSRMLRRCNFWKWKWKLAPIRKTNKVTSILYVCQVVEGIQRENIALHPAFRLSSR